MIPHLLGPGDWAALPTGTNVPATDSPSVDGSMGSGVGRWGPLRRSHAIPPGCGRTTGG